MAASLNNLAVLYHARGRVEQALAVDREVLGIRLRRLGPDHPQSIQSLNNLAVRLHTLGRNDDARPLLDDALARGRRVWGVSHPNYGTLQHTYGEVEMASGNLDAARLRLEEALRVYRLQPAHRHLGLVLYQLAQVDARQGNASQALDLLS